MKRSYWNPWIGPKSSPVSFTEFQEPFHKTSRWISLSTPKRWMSLKQRIKKSLKQMNFELLTHLWKRQVSQYKTVHLFCLQFQPSDALTLQRFFFLIHLKINYEYLNIEFRYMKIHIFALRWRDEIRRSSQLRTLLKLIVVNRTWKKFRTVRDLNPWPLRYRWICEFSYI